jgi:hypothetical protein
MTLTELEWNDDWASLYATVFRQPVWLAAWACTQTAVVRGRVGRSRPRP